ncbi:hypothetical protein HBH98_247100 [Parastagonospora nodorum]|nr:hypothetical protein HBH53_251070 [Parastagonospora nodorum]KAH3956137.1 hypothetical protein HBH51_251720 [Parastagonospora nodorum]KAH4215395.1 hypothetical protein HBI06_253460 [Parastagonospora nodorum]KAH4223090.1 hypothetical protein HBI05_249200 [Parastagonospora nodorum]KAH4333544.1 hypothetical protein HBH98_247100 [Parastagonospora nodorum]
MPPPRTREYTVGWICALPVELAAAQAMLDEEYAKLPREKFDPNLYTLGRVGALDVVITCLPAGHMGIGPAAAGAARMVSRFGSIRFGLMVGVGGGVPSPSVDIRLGDVVISHPFKQHGGVVQYDLGKTVRAGQTTRTGSLNSPPPVLLNAVSQLRADRYRGRDSLAQHLAGFDTFPRFSRMSSGPDILFEADCTHMGRLGCDNCDTNRYIQRSARQPPDQVEVHYGTIASGNQVMRDGITRDLLSNELGGVLCYEMEAAGLMNWFPCLVIRGISDYADSHKSKLWQPYAAATAAACAKAILHFVSPSGEATEDPIHSLCAYDIPFRIRPLSLKKFVDRPDDMRALKVALLPRSQTVGRSVMVVHGLSGIGKTQLVAHFARRHQRDFSSILWLDASNHVSLQQSLVSCVAHIRAHWCESASPATSRGPVQGMDDGLREMNEWLGRPDNWGWLLIVDGLQPDANGPIPSSIHDYAPDVDHGAVLVTTRMSQLCEFGVSREITKADRASSAAMIKIWCSRDLAD